MSGIITGTIDVMYISCRISSYGVITIYDKEWYSILVIISVHCTGQDDIFC